MTGVVDDRSVAEVAARGWGGWGAIAQSQHPHPAKVAGEVAGGARADAPAQRGATACAVRADIPPAGGSQVTVLGCRWGGRGGISGRGPACGGSCAAGRAPADRSGRGPDRRRIVCGPDGGGS